MIVGDLRPARVLFNAEVERYNLRRTNWNLLQEQYRNGKKPVALANPNDMAKEITTKLKRAITASVVRIKCATGAANRPWPQQLEQLRKNSRRSRKCYQRSATAEERESDSPEGLSRSKENIRE